MAYETNQRKVVDEYERRVKEWAGLGGVEPHGSLGHTFPTTSTGIVEPPPAEGPRMAEYLIRCVNARRPHEHVTSADVQELSGDSYGNTKTFLVETIRAKLAEGDRFNTYSPSTDKMAGVHSDTCRIAGCEIQTIRSDADAITDNNLDNLRCNPVGRWLQ